jgi:hypothetical protein
MTTELIVNRIEDRCDRSAIKEIQIGNKILPTPSYIPSVSNLDELSLLASQELLISHPVGIHTDIFSAQTLSRTWIPAFRQTNLDLEPIRGDIENLVSNSLLIVDPLTDAFRWNIKCQRAKGFLLRDVIMSLRRFPLNVKEVMSKSGPELHDSAWINLAKKNRVLTLVDWFLEEQTRLHADIKLPPVPVFDGDSKLMLDLIEYINRKSSEVVQDRWSGVCAFNLPLNYRVFRDSKIVKALISMIDRNMSPHRVLHIKFHNLEHLLDRPMYTYRLREFLAEITDINLGFNDSIFIIVSGVGSEGWPMLTSGIDSYIEPLTSISSPRRGARKKISDGPGIVDDIDECQGLGGWLHPALRKMITMKDLLEIVEQNGGRLPHNCPSCGKYHGKLSSKNLPEAVEWRKDRKSHAFNVRTEEIQLLNKAVSDGDVRAIALRLLSPESGDKNLIDLTPYV